MLISLRRSPLLMMSHIFLLSGSGSQRQVFCKLGKSLLVNTSPLGCLHSLIPTLMFSHPHQMIEATDGHMDRIEQEREQRKEERLLLNLQQRLACNGSEGPSSVDPGDAAKAKRAADSNPFLAVPLQFGEKEVSPVVFPAKVSNEAVLENHAVENHVGKNHISVLETFAPAIEAMKSSLCDSEDGVEKGLLNRRPAVQFKIGIGKKSLGAAMDLSLQNKGVKKITSWLGKDNEKDDKKRRAEQILKETMENPQELAQL
ncbi:hypothetical protein L1049_002765 [Liquidambar formosana]|uniref:Uncharacterized protein n=1 Tax=Liquidambar formosana TaxID=63359 RepID=A0AAP0NGP1_LIQFO